jgi:hypothetical protein
VEERLDAVLLIHAVAAEDVVKVGVLGCKAVPLAT